MARDNGIGTDYKISYPIALTIMAFLAISLYNCLELTLVIFTTFKRRHGLYFYSLLVAAWGILPYSLGFFLKFYEITHTQAIYITLIAVGWPCMVTGQSLVLYSRLHLITRSISSRSQKWVLIMIIVNAVICHIPTIVLLYGANSGNSGPFLTPYSIYEKVQITVFFLQEVIISGIYVFKTLKILRAEGGIRGRNSRMVMTHLVWVNMIIIVLDVTLLAIEYAGFYDIQTTYKAAVYSVKLKMEFAILNKLLDLFQGRIQDSSDDPRSHSHGPGTTLGGTTKRSANKSMPTHNGTVTDGLPVASSLGNSAYARMNDDVEGTGINLTDMKVMKTTEVTIERTERLPEHDGSDGDLESVGGTSIKGIGARKMSASSSEIQIVRNGY
ncbi:hypothetical protein BU24DRAFT_482258 [Aaosphaeria arxii CBS 175.79]|uniref:DUF7703 domain-containing protein n=1 Tax=Aaosphaeria arxii CBS 175.79 TaxID=1450172 RepID=A0A6A5XN78_9PLEO|nr:uncharacterized protein BU24DRAFT_482258 [Aaosphaeria arxii CBS 175.79]KAF2014698.1 hypothetical protein BU24DRAFT_482258 [Aaosphaeria arxii CBS 175.79]